MKSCHAKILCAVLTVFCVAGLAQEAQIEPGS